MALLSKFLLLFICFISLEASSLSPEVIKKLIGRTIILGFPTSYLDKNLKNDIDKYNLGGVILFNKDYKTKENKNILNPKQLKNLSSSIQNYSNYKMFISIDQEGGKVSRLNSKNGFFDILSAEDVAKLDLQKAKEIYSRLASLLEEQNINLDFAPVVDLAINEQNQVIVKNQRAFSKDPKVVTKYASIFIEQMREKGIYSVLKHFPGHGSSKDDSHKGFVDITNTWQKEELEPYKNLIEKEEIDFIMTAHVFNENLDENYPATLSYKVNTKLLRDELKYKGLIISDDLQMKAISKHYTLKQTLNLAINSGVNILLFGNQLGKIKLNTIVDTIYELILEDKVKLSKIIKTNKLIDKLNYKKEQL